MGSGGVSKPHALHSSCPLHGAQLDFGTTSTVYAPNDRHVVHVARVLRLLSTKVAKLVEYFSQLDPRTYVHAFAPAPHWTQFTTTDGISYTLRYTKPLPAHPLAQHCAVSRAVATDVQTGLDLEVVVKFTATYSSEAHMFMATRQAPAAPRLHFCSQERSVGDLFVVVMDWVEQEDPADWPSAMRGLFDAVTSLHTHGMVFGDLREPNILRTKSGLQLIDFDWSGKEQLARYPLSLNTTVGWPVGVEAGGCIHSAHDLDMLNLYAKGFPTG
ncbi:hypothetical protein B0H19DRAFT_394861 [Mycena capillaripes]|nr:hypothetical protein B0H19DRAFT_394861 [Mycena capillaripes]